MYILFQKTEMWESEKTEEDMEEYIWENSCSQKNALDTLLRIKASENVSNVTKEELLASEVVKNYRNSVIALKNEGETENNMSQYKESVKKLLNIQALPWQQTLQVHLSITEMLNYYVNISCKHNFQVHESCFLNKVCFESYWWLEHCSVLLAWEILVQSSA